MVHVEFLVNLKRQIALPANGLGKMIQVYILLIHHLPLCLEHLIRRRVSGFGVVSVWRKVRILGITVVRGMCGGWRHG